MKFRDLSNTALPTMGDVPSDANNRRYGLTKVLNDDWFARFQKSRNGVTSINPVVK